MSKAILAHNTKVEFSADGTSWAEVQEPKNFASPEPQIDKVDVTHLRSPERTREFIQGLKDPGEVSFDANYVATDFNTLKTHENAGDLLYWRTTFPDNSMVEFQAFVTVNRPPTSAEEALSMAVKLQLSGPVTETPAA